MHRSGPNILEENKEIELFTHASLLRYLRFAKIIEPQITPEAAEKLSEVYCRMRMTEFNLQKSNYRITVRQLESLIRLSEAIARVELSMTVTVDHVIKAVDLLDKSIVTIDV